MDVNLLAQITARVQVILRPYSLEGKYMKHTLTIWKLYPFTRFAYDYAQLFYRSVIALYLLEVVYKSKYKLML